MQESKRLFQLFLETDKWLRETKASMYSRKTVKELRKIAKEKGIQFSYYGQKLRKAELVKALVAIN